MNSELYSIFYRKQPSNIKQLLPEANTAKCITFLNPYYLETIQSSNNLYKEFDYICSDGMIPILLQKLTRNNNSKRISFDMTSLAKRVFDESSKYKYSIYFIGAKEHEIKQFINIIQEKYPLLKIIGYHHGYVNNFDQINKTIINLNPQITIIGMGAPKQDEFALKLKKNGYKGTIYTCGGFIHQTTNNINYYPKWIDKLNLRTISRLIYEPYVWKRVLKYYPPIIIKYFLFLCKIKTVK